jgi:hypothetical protein
MKSGIKQNLLAGLTLVVPATDAGFALADTLDPHLHFSLAAGETTGSTGSRVPGSHDPSGQLRVQAIEPGLSLRLHEHLEGFITWHFSYAEEEAWEEELEEGFGKVMKLPGGLELRGGRMLNRFGERNAKHRHAWNTIDQHLVIGRFLGPDGLKTDGAELTGYLPGTVDAALTLSLGEVPGKRPDHGEEPSMQWVDELITANLVMSVNRDDFHRFHFSSSFALGDNTLADRTRIAGLGVQYLWRENGLEAGGRQLRWMSEGLVRNLSSADAACPAAHDFGFYTELTYTTAGHVDCGLRLGFVEGVEAFALEQHVRISPYLRVPLAGYPGLQARLQVNLDELKSTGDVQGIWLQLGYSFGGREVR